MHTYLHILGLSIPTYGFLIALGVVISNLIAIFELKRAKLDFNDFIILEAYCFLGAFIGAKILYLLVSFKEIDWARIKDWDYFNNLMLSGFVFYGGMILGFVFVLVAGKIHNIDAEKYIRSFIFLIPFMHCFGRLGCFMAGCCYGIPYDGFGAVVFPENSFALSGISLFPVQLVEAAGLMLISLVIFCLMLRKNWYYTVETYFISYAVLRFCLEKFRYDQARGFYASLSTSQWISIGLLVLAFVSIMFHKKNVSQTNNG